jgi:hypothetical protein
MRLVWLALTILCVYANQDNLDRINSPINDRVARPTERGLSWDEMFAACKHNAENGLPCDDSQMSWMSEQWRRKEKLDSVGVAWYIACISLPAEDDENANAVGLMMGSACCVTGIAFLRHSMARIWNGLTIFCVCSIVAQGDLDRASLAVESASINSPDDGGGEHPVRSLLILVEAFVANSMLARAHTLLALEIL